MKSPAPSPGALTVEQRRLLESWLEAFERSWEPDALAVHVGSLPAGGPLRFLALLGLVRVDLGRQWQHGRRPNVEAYLAAYPELGTADVAPPELIQAEIQARRRAGDPVNWAEYARRFPRQTEAFRRSRDSDATASGRTAASLPDPAAKSTDASVVREADTAYGTLKPSDQPSLTGSVPPARAPAGEAFGRYRLLRRLGQGAMGTVYLAHDTQLDRPVALKMPHFHAGEDPDALARFHREARAVATLDHPNICHVYDVGEIEGRPYFTMAYVEGQSLGEYLRAHSPLPQRQAVEIVYRLALALEEAHALGIIHRDLKPSNIMMNKRGEPVVMDFGLVRRINQDVRLTQEGSAMGTPAYMPPEQVNGDLAAMGPGCDIYSLGVVLYELLTGQVPFHGGLAAIMTRILTDPPPPPRTLRPDLDARLEAVCLQALAKAPADRFPSMKAFADALADAQAPGSVRAPQRTSRPSQQEALVTAVLPPKPVAKKKSSRRLVVALVVAVAVGLLGAVAVRFVLRPGGNGSEFAVNGTTTGPEGTPPYSPATPPSGTSDATKIGPSATTHTAVEPIPETRPVEIRSEPNGAEVIHEGKSWGKTPLALPVRPGTYRLTLKRAGYQPLEKDLVVESGAEPLRQTYPLKPVLYAVTIKTKPPGAEASVDGVKAGKTPAEVKLAAGPHEVTLSLGRFRTARQQFTVTDDPGSWQVPVVVLTADPARKERFALLVGVHSPGGGLPDFVHAEPDVVELGRVLVAAGYRPENVMVMTQSPGPKPGRLPPTAANIRARLQELADPARGCTPADSLLVALVGDVAEPPLDKGPCFCPADADPKAPQTLLPLAEVYESLGRCRAGTRLVLLDGWRHDPAPGQPLPALPVSRVRGAGPDAPPGVAVFSSCAVGESGYQHPEERHGLFFHALIEGLQGAADPGGLNRVNLGDLAQYVTDHVGARSGKRQRPELQGGEPVLKEELLAVPLVLRAYRRACRLLDQKDYDGAVKALNQAEKADATYVELYTRRAEANFRGKDYPAAIKDCDTALELDPSDATAWSHKGEALVKHNQFSQAIASHNKAVKLDPSYAPAYDTRGKAYWLKGWQEAQAGKTRDARDDYAKAENDFRDALRLKPKWARPHVNLGLLAQDRGNPAAAEQEFQKACDLEPQAAEPYFYLGKLYAKRGDLNPAIDSYGEAIKHSEDGDHIKVAALRGRADAYFDKKDYGPAIDDYSEGLRLENDKWLRLGRGMAYRATKQYPQALPDLTAAINIDNQFAAAYFQRALVYMAQEKPDYNAAVKDLEMVTTRLAPQLAVPLRAVAHDRLADALEARGAPGDQERARQARATAKKLRAP
jgi:serine/threonine protein kinase/tetratricopeptide (TPR) repeat protein